MLSASVVALLVVAFVLLAGLAGWVVHRLWAATGPASAATADGEG